MQTSKALEEKIKKFIPDDDEFIKWTIGIITPTIVLDPKLAKFMMVESTVKFDSKRLNMFSHLENEVVYSLPLLLMWWRLYFCKVYKTYVIDFMMIELPEDVANELGIKDRKNCLDYFVTHNLKELYTSIPSNYLDNDDMFWLIDEHIRLKSQIDAF